MSGAHTPGPWIAAIDDNGDNLSVMGTGDENYVVGGCGCCGSPYSSRKHGKANAHLIAAAPEMLQALLSCDALLERIGYEPDSIAREGIAAAIAKARGQS